MIKQMDVTVKYKLNDLMTSVIALAVNIICFSFSNAHDIHTSELRVVQYDSVLHLELRLNAFELEFLGGREISKNGVIDWDRFSDSKERVINKLKESLILELNNKPLHTDKTGLTVDDTHHLIYRAHYYLPENPGSGLLKIESKLREFTSRSHITRVSFNKSEQQQNAQLEGDRNSAALGGLLFGFDMAVISGAIPFVKEQFSLSPATEGWFVSSGLNGTI